MKEQKDRDQKTKEITTSSNETLGFESELHLSGFDLPTVFSKSYFLPFYGFDIYISVVDKRIRETKIANYVYSLHAKRRSLCRHSLCTAAV